MRRHLLNQVRLAAVLALTSVAGILTQTAAAQQLVVRYTFDEPSGDARDTGIAPAANGKLQANATRTTNTPGGASRFALDLSAPGLESYVDAGDPAKVDTLPRFTLTTWLNLQGLNSDQGGSGNVRLLAKQGPGPAFDGFSWNLNNPNLGDRAADNFRLGLFIGGENGFGFAQSTEDTGADNRWTFLAVTYDGTTDFDNMIFYVGDETNAVQQLGDVMSSFAGPVKSTAGVARFGIGFTDGAPDIDFAANGFQDDVRVYDGVLSLEQLDGVRRENLAMRGDFNVDGKTDVLDIDSLTDEVFQQTDRPLFDLTGEGRVDQEDRRIWVEEIRKTYFGDANLDGEFNSSDFVIVFQAGQYEDAVARNSTWGTGDWSGDKEFDSADFVVAFQAGGFEKGPRAASAAVPEPAALPWVTGLLLTGLCQRCRKQRAGNSICP